LFVIPPRNGGPAIFTRPVDELVAAESARSSLLAKVPETRKVEPVKGLYFWAE